MKGKKDGQGVMQYGSGDMYVGAYKHGSQIIGTLQLEKGTYSGRFVGSEGKEKAHSTVPRTGKEGAREMLDARVKDSVNHSSFTWNDETHYEVIEKIHVTCISTSPNPPAMLEF